MIRGRLTIFIAAVLLSAPLVTFAESVTLQGGEKLEGKVVEITDTYLKTGKLTEKCFLKFKDRIMYIRAIHGRKLSGVYLILDKIPKQEITAERGYYTHIPHRDRVCLTLHSGIFYCAATHRQPAVMRTFDRYYTELKVRTGK